MNTTEALDIHSNPDGNTSARWREARAVLEAAVKDAAEMQATRREALAAAAMINRLASVSRHLHPHNLPNEVAATYQSDASAFLSRHGLDAGGRWRVEVSDG